MIPHDHKLPMAGAIVSRCQRYRYSLWRIWDRAQLAGLVNFILLNPSTADAVRSDPTLVRCFRRARSMGYGGLVITNLYALRSSDPRALTARDVEPVGPDNDTHLLDGARVSSLIVCGWGAHAEDGRRGRDQEVLRLLASLDKRAHVLGLTGSGHPRHPLYVPYRAQPLLWERGSALALSDVMPRSPCTQPVQLALGVAVEEGRRHP